ncbi:MAG: hypothetical protein VXW22_00715 [Pseudomonadota bacterium]|nr:hypothetical protein [Pseudomonadota bacterium]
MIAILAFGLTGACEHKTGGAQPAVLLDSSAPVLDRLSRQVSDHIGRTGMSLGPEDLRSQSSFTMLPPPLGPSESNSAAIPVRFRLIIDHGTCFAARDQSDDRIELYDVSCAAVQ